MDELAREIALRLASNLPLTEILVRAERMGYSVAFLPAARGSTLIHVLVIDKDDEHVMDPTHYAKVGIDREILEVYKA